MKRPRSLVLQLLLGGLVLASAGCRQPLPPMRFNNLIARSMTKLSSPAANFAKALDPLSKGLPAEQSAAQSAYSEMQSNLQAVKKTFDEIVAPLGSNTAQAMLDKAREFMAAEQKIFDECLTPAMNTLKNGALSDAEKYAAIQPLLQQAGAYEAPVLSALQKAQDDYCKEQNYAPK